MGSLVSGEIRWSNIDVVSFGLDERWAPILLWVGVPSGTLLGSGVQIVQICKTILRRNDVNDIDCEIGEVNRFLVTGGDPITPKFLGTADLEAFSTDILGKSKFTKKSWCPQDPKGFYAARNEKIFALTSPYINAISRAENERSQFKEEFINHQRHYVTLPGDTILQPLRDVFRPGYYNTKLAEESDTSRIEFFEGQDEDFEEGGIWPDYMRLRTKQTPILRFEKLVKMLNSWSTYESRIVGRVEFSPYVYSVWSDDYVIEWSLEEVGSSRTPIFLENLT